jgi:hypothetical protein
MLARAAGLGWPEAFEHMGQGVRLAADADADADAGVVDGDLAMRRQRFCWRSKLYLLQCAILIQLIFAITEILNVNGVFYLKIFCGLDKLQQSLYNFASPAMTW